MMDGNNALVLDIGVSGALVEHYGVCTPGDKFILSFRWQGTDVEFVCAVVRSIVTREAAEGQSTVSHTGVRFTKAIGDSEKHLEDFMATFVGRILAAQKANAAGEHRTPAPTILEQLGGARRSRTPGYVSYRLKDDTWRRVPTTSATQPADGFTVAAHEDEEEVETLCRAYEQADEEGRQLIRLVSEISSRSPKQ